jgi:hypothetical protein
MRSKTYSKIRVSSDAIFISLLFLFMSSTFSAYVSADDPSLYIVPSSLIIDEGEPFWVTVYENDEDGAKVEGATVYIASYGANYTTDLKGNAFFIAPNDVDEVKEVRIYATKEGYTTSSVLIKINPLDSLWEQIINNRFFLIFVSLIILVFAILFVHFRQKKTIYSRAKEISNEKLIEKYETDQNYSSPKEKADVQHYSNKAVRTKRTEDSKVEEIRITRPGKEKEVVDVKTKEDETEKVVNRKKTKQRDYDWFEGTDDIRYEIDKLTGEVDEEGIDKWYEGVDGLKEKIDERMKKKEKKKKDEKDK